MIRRPPRSTQSRSSAASDVYKRQVVDRGSRTGQVVYLVRFDEERESDVVTVGFEVRVVQEMGDVLLATRVVVIHAENLMVPFEQCLAEMGAEETGTAGDNYVFPNCVLHRSLLELTAEGIIRICGTPS